MKIFVSVVLGSFALALLSVLALGGLWSMVTVSRCHQAGEPYGVVTEWSPIDGCTAMILGTKIRLDRPARPSSTPTAPTHWSAERGYY